MATPFKLNNGMLLLSTEAPGGVYNSVQLKKIAQLSDGDAALVKATEDQRLALFVPEAKAKTVIAELKATGLGVRDYQDGLHQPVTCVGELCPQHQQDAMGAAMDLSQALAPIAKQAFASSLKIGINGCLSCCVPTHTLDVSVIGDTSGYRISIGGKNSQIPEMASFLAEGVPAGELPQLLSKVVNLYRKLAQPGERLQDVLERCGATEFIAALAPYSQDAAGDASGDPFGGMGGDEPAPVADDLDLAGLEGEPPVDLEPELGPLAEGGNDDLMIDDLSEEQMAIGIDEPMAGELALEDEIAIEAGGGDVLNDDLDLGDAGLEDGKALAEASFDEPSLDVAGLEDEALPEGSLSMDELGDELSLVEEPLVAPATAAEKPKLVAIAKLAASTTGDGADEDGEEAHEIEGDEADAFEAKLEESIVEEESHPLEEDHNEEERLAALSLVETETELPSVEAVHANLGVDDSFDNLEIDHDVDLEVEVDMEPEEIPEPEPFAKPARRAASSASSQSFKGIDIGEGGRLTLSFASGATVVLDPRTMTKGQTRDFNFGGTQIVVTQDAAGFTVEVDGVGLFLPVKAA